jgi:magnesium-transporting ATPase (P-type)
MAQQHGFELSDANDQMVHVQTKVKQGESGDNWDNLNMLSFEVVCRMEFTSDRKRMSIIVKDLQDGKYKLFSKGADNIMLERLDPQSIDPK